MLRQVGRARRRAGAVRATLGQGERRRGAGRLQAEGKGGQFTADDVIAFLRHEKRAGVVTWKRLRIAESIDLYQRTYCTRAAVDLSSICSTLREHAKKERSASSDSPAGNEDDGTIEEAVGLIDPNEPEVIREFRRALRLQKRELETERAYVKHVQAFKQTSFSKALEKAVLRTAFRLALEDEKRIISAVYEFVRSGT